MKIFKNVYLTDRIFLFFFLNICLFIAGYFLPFFYALGNVMLLSGSLLVVIDLLFLYPVKNGLEARRKVTERLSNGDENRVSIVLTNQYAYPVHVQIIDEIPVQFQYRDFEETLALERGQTTAFNYTLKPVERGEYHFGKLHVFVQGKVGFIKRRYTFSEDVMVPVYPSFIQMRKYELLAISNRLTEEGVKKIRKVGHQMEFDQIREYVKGDDSRTINWKATARKAEVMVNQYQDEKSQQVFSLIDMGRTMKSPFDGMTLLDYAINASLVISNIAMLKGDKAGLCTFNHSIDSFLPADRKKTHLLKIMEMLYRSDTGFLESNIELLYTMVRRKIHQRSLLLLFTHFESLSSALRYIHIFQKLAKDHLLVVIFFQNTELYQLSRMDSENLEEVYIKTIAEQLLYEKKQIVKEFNKLGIHAILSEPQNLSVETLNKYLNLKARGII